MIVFYTRFCVRDDFNHSAMLEMALDSVNGMKNAPASFMNHHWDGSDSKELKEGRNTLAYETDPDSKRTAFRIAIVDEDDELWTSDVALNDCTHEIQLRLARETRIASAELDNNFHLPYLFRKIVMEGIAGNDNDLPVADKPIYVTEQNVNIIADIINRKTQYALPVIYVSHPFSGDKYRIDEIELAKDMAGSAHILVEESPAISALLKQRTNGSNPYNGAVEIYFRNGSSRYICMPEMTPNQFRYKISHVVYTRMAMRNIDDELSLNAIKLHKRMKTLEDSAILELEIERLEEKKKELEDLYEIAAEINGELEKDKIKLEEANRELENKNMALVEALKRKNENMDKCVQLAFEEEEFYEDEVKHFVLGCIRQSIKQYGSEEKLRRDYHILNNIANQNNCSDKPDMVKKTISDTLKKGRLSETDERALIGIGFVKKTGDHTKFIFHGDERYIVTVSSTPSDHCGGRNIAHDAINLIFGRY